MAQISQISALLSRFGLSYVKSGVIHYRHRNDSHDQEFGPNSLKYVENEVAEDREDAAEL